MNQRVLIPSPLRSYCGGAAAVDVDCPAAAPTLGDVLAALDAAHPGILFRMQDEQGRLRPHIKVFVGDAVERDLAVPVPPGAEVMIVAALSGG